MAVREAIDWDQPIVWDDGTECEVFNEGDFLKKWELVYVRLTGGKPQKWDNHLCQRTEIYVFRHTGRVQGSEGKCATIRNFSFEEARQRMNEKMGDNEQWGMF